MAKETKETKAPERIDRSILSAEEEESHLAFIKKQIIDHPVVKTHHGKWKELIEWENGDQFSVWDREQASMIPVELKRRKKRVIINLMKPLAETIEGKLNFMSQFEGVPNSSELKDITGSQVATKFIAHNDYVNDVESLNEDLKYDLIRTGNSFRKWTWETGKSGRVRTDSGERDEAGELVGDVPSVFNIRPDPTAKNIETCRWLIEIGEVTEEDILDSFEGLQEEEIRFAQKEEKGSSAESDKYRGMYEKPEDKDKDEKTQIVAWYWERSSARYPAGRHIISIPGLVLWAKASPAKGKIPYFHYGYKRYGNSFWHTGPLHHVQDIQRDFNRSVSIISEHFEGWRAKMAVEEGAILKEGSFTTDSFEILEIRRGQEKPVPLTMPQLSPEVMNHRDFLLGAMDIVSNVHEVSRSQLPQYATRAPASLYAQMLEQEDLKIAPMVKRINRTLKREAQFRLEMMGTYYKNPRMVKIIGVNERSTIDYFSASQIAGNYDIKLVQGVSIHQSKTIQQRMLLDLKQAGAPIDWDTILKLLWEGDVSEKIRGTFADEQRASRENQAFLNGTYKKPFKDGGVELMVTDNHEVHIKSHGNLAKSEEAQEWDEKTWNDFNEHYFFHMALFSRMVQTAQEETAQIPGQPGAPQPGPAGASPGGMIGAGEEQTQAVEDALPF